MTEAPGLQGQHFSLQSLNELMPGTGGIPGALPELPLAGQAQVPMGKGLLPGAKDGDQENSDRKVKLLIDFHAYVFFFSSPLPYNTFFISFPPT